MAQEATTGIVPTLLAVTCWIALGGTVSMELLLYGGIAVKQSSGPILTFTPSHKIISMSTLSLESTVEDLVRYLPMYHLPGVKFIRCTLSTVIFHWRRRRSNSVFDAPTLVRYSFQLEMTLSEHVTYSYLRVDVGYSPPPSIITRLHYRNHIIVQNNSLLNRSPSPPHKPLVWHVLERLGIYAISSWYQRHGKA